MKINSLSPSKLKQVRLCEARLMARLEDEEYEEASGEPAKTGTLAHKAAELWFKPNPDYVEALKQAKLQVSQQVMSLPENERLTAYWNGVNQARQQILAGGCHKYILPPKESGESEEDYTARLINETFQQAMKDVSKRDLPSEPASIQDAKELFSIIVSQYPRDQIDVVFVERRYKGTLGTSGIPIHCILDMAVDRGGGSLEIVDYKTGFTTMSTEEMYSEDQVLINLIAVHQDPSLSEYPDKRFTYFWVRSRTETGPVMITQDRLRDYEAWLTLKYQYLLDLKEPKETINQYCASCGRRIECTAYRELVSEAMCVDHVLTPEEVKQMDVETLMRQYGRARSQEKLVKESKTMLGKMLLEKLDEVGAKSIEASSFKVTKQQRSDVVFDAACVQGVCSNLGISPWSVMSVSAAKLRKALENHPAALNEVFQSARVGPSAAFVVVKEISAKKDSESMVVKAAENRLDPHDLTPKSTSKSPKENVTVGAGMPLPPGGAI